MSDNLKPKKIDDNNVAYHDKLTNDPVAIVTRIKPRYGTKSDYIAKWHPVMKELYPDETSSFSHMNIGTADSATTIQNFISGAYSRLLSPNAVKADPMKVRNAGEMSKTWDDKETVNYSGSPVTRHYTQFHVLDNDENHVATINVDKNYVKNIGTNKDEVFSSKRDAHIEFLGQQPNESQMKILQTKNPGMHPMALLSQVHHWQTLKSVEPRFIGLHHYSDSHSHHAVYSTKLSPEEATTEYVKHLQSSNTYSRHSFQRISPTLVMAKHNPTGGFIGKTEFIDGSIEGKISHTKINNYPEDSYNNKKLNNVIE